MPANLNSMQQGAVTGGILGIGLGAVGGQIQNWQQEGMMQEQLVKQEQLSSYNEGLQEKLWQNTGSWAAVPYLQKAGLNPALVYSNGGGAGGSTNLAQGNVQGGNATNPGGMGIEMAQTMANLELMEAQKKNVEADTANKEAQNPNIPKQGANIDANTALQQAQTKMQEIQNKIQGSTTDDQIKLIQETADQATTTADILTTQLSSDRQSLNEKIKLLQAQTAETLTKAALGKSQIDVNDASIQKIRQDIINSITATDNNTRQTHINALQQEFNTSHPGIWNVIGGSIEKAINAVNVLGTKEELDAKIDKYFKNKK